MRDRACELGWRPAPALLLPLLLLALPLAHTTAHTASATSRFSDMGASSGQILYPVGFMETQSTRRVRRQASSRSLPPPVHSSKATCDDECVLRLQGHNGTIDVALRALSPDQYAFRSDLLQVHYVYESELRVSNYSEHRRCLYWARVSGQHASMINLCDGMYGSLIMPDGVYLLEPIALQQPNTTQQHRQANDAHLMFRAQKQTFQYDELPVDGDGERNSSQHRHSTTHRKQREKRKPVKGDGHGRFRRSSTNSWDYFVEVLVVADHKMSQYHRHNVENYILTLFSTVASIYRHPSLHAAINIVVTKLMVLKYDPNELLISERAQPTLTNFCEWQHRLDEHDYDVAILLTRENICRAPTKCDTLGLAELGTMCMRQRSCAIIEDNGLSAAFTIAHELGHVFNIPHDDERRCSAHMDVHRDNYHIMAPTLEYNTHPWSWSPCSQAILEEFLDNGRADCLLDKPDEHRYIARMVSNESPGLMFTANQQCQYVFGPESSLCPYMPTCKRLWCATNYGHQTGCRTQHMPWADGTPCDTNKWCYRGHCRAASPEQRAPVDGHWGGWHAWGDCSRTCGGGIARATRQCDNPAPDHGGKYCVGERVRYRSCNTNDCPWDTDDFRTKQCASFNNDSHGIHGVPETVQWTPKWQVSPAERCVLFCKVNGSAAFYKLKPKVIDGTPCDRETDDVCVDGQCRPAGCDHRLSSNVQRDRCGICGGDGSSCRKVNGVDNEVRRYGYNHVVRIPSGATNIDIRQRGHNDKKEDDNYLALRDSRGVYLLNGQWQVSVFAHSISVRGTVIDYSGSDTIEERIHSASVPTLEDLYIEILSVGDQYPPNIHYEYIIPNEPSAPQRHVHQTYAQPHTSYYWRQARNWSSCDRVCNGQQHRPYVCVSSENDRQVDHRYCVMDRPSAEHRACNIDCQLTWKTHFLTECSKECGWGTRTQSVWCAQQYFDQKNDTVVPDGHCETAKRPTEVVDCYGECKAKKWIYGEWSQCSATCGGGSQSREFRCVDDERKPKHDHHCEHLPKEPLDKRCNDQLCPTWVTGAWAQCTKSCDGGIRMRHSECRDPAGQTLARTACRESDLVDREQCNTHPCTQWHFGSWTQCSVSCGTGVARRSATCVNSNREPMNEALCQKAAKIVSKPCKLAACPRWLIEEWSQCSRTCREGWQRRQVKCVDGADRTLDDERCLTNASTAVPDKIQSCNRGPCPFWREKEWSACSVSCGSGMRERSVECVHNGQVADDQFCDEDEKPELIQSCQLIDCSAWEISPWEPCSSACGQGRQRRRVTCTHEHSGSCDSRLMPIQIRPCEKQPCARIVLTTASSLLYGNQLEGTTLRSSDTQQSPPDMKTTVDYQPTNAVLLNDVSEPPVRWATGDFTPCTMTCGSGITHRQVKCRDWLGRLLDDIYCRHQDKPTEVKTCDNIPACGTWHSGPWTPCPQCVDGHSFDPLVRRRQVLCLSVDYDDRHRETACDQSQKPANREACPNVAACHETEPTQPPYEHTTTTSTTTTATTTAALAPDYSTPYWRSTDWSPDDKLQCSVTCGNGVTVRSVQCVHPPNWRPSYGSCDQAKRPPSMRRCQLSVCPFWKIVSGFSEQNEWLQCSRSCGGGVQQRIIHCIDLTISSEPQEAAHCANVTQPITKQTCNEAFCPDQPETSMESHSASEETSTDTYQWVTDPWSQCSKQCGRGVRARRVWCVSVLHKTQVPVDWCPTDVPPKAVAPCRVQRCTRWRSTKWTKCSATCGTGAVKQRVVGCYRGRRHRVSDKQCADKMKPPQVRTCDDLPPCSRYKWLAADWSPCEAAYCEEGTQKRHVSCVNEERKAAPESMCDGDLKPAVSQLCIDRRCPYEWIPGEWSQCSQTCGTGVQQRQLDCRVRHSALLSNKPTFSEAIDSRTLLETTTEDSGNYVVVMNSHCHSLPRPILLRNCTLGDCDGKYLWRIGPWTPCSSTCGTGVRRRRVHCVTRAGHRTKRANCDEANRPPRREQCHQRQCAPSDCVEVRQQNAIVDDGYQTLSANGFSIQAYCHLMNTSSPRTYIDVNADTNYAEIYGKRLLLPFTCPRGGERHDDCQCSDEPSKSGKTVYDRLRVDLHMMKINYHDMTFARTLYGRPQMYATAGDCYSASDCPQGEFSINLQTTGLRVSDEVKWMAHGHRSSVRIDRNKDSTQVTGRCGGYCGYCSPDRRVGLKFVFDTQPAAFNWFGQD